MRKGKVFLVTLIFMITLLFSALQVSANDDTADGQPPSEDIATSAASDALDKDLVVLFTNDVHNAYLKSEDCLGYASVAWYKNEMETNNNHVELVDAGDAIQGGVIGTLSKGQYIADIMGEIGYSLGIPGNHEFDFGMDNFLNLANTAKYQYICCNFMDLRTGKTVFDPYKIVDYNGTKVAYIGITTPETFTKSTPKYFQDENGNYIYGFCEGNDGQNLYNQVQKTIDEAKNNGADYVIAIGHAGVDPSSTPWTSREIIAHTDGLDVFLDGHSHSTIPSETCTDRNNNPVILTSTGTKLNALGKVVIGTDGTISSELITDIAEEDPDALKFINDITAEFDELQKEVVAHSDIDLVVNDPVDSQRMIRSQETNLGDFCADAYRTMLDADIAFVNGGGIRTDIKAGDITYGNIIEVHPFGNSLCLVEATGQQIKDALEFGASAAGAGENGEFLQVSGLTYEIDTTIPSSVQRDDQGAFTGVSGAYRVKNIMVGGETLDVTKTYKLASHNYMLKNGGGGFNMFQGDTLLQDEVMIDNQALINYMIVTLNGNVSADSEYANVYGSGRIKVLMSSQAPTCTEDGYQDILQGSGTIREVLPAAGHTFGDWIIEKEATVKEAGSKYHTCSVCGVRETQEIPKLSDSAEAETKQPTAAKTTSVKTGDAVHPEGYILIAILAIAATCTITLKRKREKGL